MADTGAPEPARDLLSAEAHRYVDQVPVMQAQAARNPYLNGEDSRGRVDPMAELQRLHDARQRLETQ